MGGITSSDFNREELAQASWLVEHGGVDSAWAQFCMRRYGTGFAATGVGMNVAVPHLLRRRLQDWAIKGCNVYLGSNYVSFGRELGSLSRSDARLFHGVDIRFGEHGRSSWLWYCSAHEWLLQLHKAILEPLPALPEWAQARGMTSMSISGQAGAHRWPGRPRYLGEPPPGKPTEEEPTSAESPAEEPQPVTVVHLAQSSQAVQDNSGTAERRPDEEAATNVAAAPLTSNGDANNNSPHATVGRPVDRSTERVEHQLSLFLGNSNGHVGLLVLPVPMCMVSMATAAVAHWSEECEVPLTWAGRRYKTAEDFSELQQAALNMPDLFLLGLECEVAMAMTPDWTWEKYPRGFGEAAVFQAEEAEDADEDWEIAEAIAAVEAAEAAEVAAEPAFGVENNPVTEVALGVGGCCGEAATPGVVETTPKGGLVDTQ